LELTYAVTTSPESTLADTAQLADALRTHFGYDTFRGRQEDVVREIIEGRDAFVIMPTGAGKSLCYQLPALLQKGTALVISPLIALMKNQVDQLSALGIEAGFLNSTMSRGDYMNIQLKALKGTLKRDTAFWLYRESSSWRARAAFALGVAEGMAARSP
jgi:ATP-dependent DNA helicase RecQ